MKRIVYLFLIFSVKIYAQSGASAHSDALHAFDEPNSGSGGGFGILGFIILLILFLVAMFIWGQSMKNDEK